MITAYNPTTYQGIRVSAFVKFNDEWNLLLQQVYQILEADGRVRLCTLAGRLECAGIQSVSSNKDQFEDTAWTLNGKVGPLKLVYTGGYLESQSHQVRTTRPTPAGCLCRLLSVRWTCGMWHRCDQCVLFAERRVEGQRTKYPPDP